MKKLIAKASSPDRRYDPGAKRKRSDLLEVENELFLQVWYNRYRNRIIKTKQIKSVDSPDESETESGAISDPGDSVAREVIKRYGELWPVERF